MGKVIMCVGALAEKPLCLEGSERKLYSIEELCYYISTNIYGIDIGFFNEALLNFIEEDLRLPVLKKELKKLLLEGNSLKDLVTVLLCASDLYDKEEILRILNILSRISNMENWEKRAHLGYQALREGNYLLALSYFRGILKEDKISEKDYGLILMAIGLCLIHTSSYKEAADCFYKAYMHTRTRENLIYTLLSLKLGGLSEEFKKKAGNLKEDDPVLKEVDKIWEEAVERVKRGDAYLELLEAIKQSEKENRQDAIDRKIQDFKREYREGLKHGLI